METNDGRKLFPLLGWKPQGGAAFRNYMLEDTATAVNLTVSQKRSRGKYNQLPSFSIFGKLSITSRLANHLEIWWDGVREKFKSRSKSREEKGRKCFGEWWVCKQVENKQHFGGKTCRGNTYFFGWVFYFVQIFVALSSPLCFCSKICIANSWGKVNEIMNPRSLFSFFQSMCT